ncbi:Ankyrin repeat domain-containing protein 50 [Termitomyces sp. J132]|nr:Ankyrin repeat domain-containing protein 50 [Termitomyces sp. J132]
MERSQLSFDQFGLHTFATVGDDEGVDRALSHGADINALDSAGRTALMCAVAGEHWQEIDASNASIMTPKRLNTIRRLLSDPRISLFTLNGPQSLMNGVIPLGMAAWLNMEEAVQILLEESFDSVSVDGTDAHGATALMYAARDGGLRVVQLLLSHGARPDFRDCNHRTPVQFALDHPQILWLFETILRRHRWRESQSADRNKLFPSSEGLLDLAFSAMPSDSLEPPPLSIFTSQGTSRLTDTLISSISLPDVPFLHSLLFSPALPASSPPALYPMSTPILVNHPDAAGWSPIHHCVAAKLPCIDILDALYCAGAEIALFTTQDHSTPLHILAKSARLSPEYPDHALSLYHFTVHLVRDLRAPLSARDKNDETCIHIAAEHGNCIELLMILLELDSTGSVRELRNGRGLTALEVSKPEFRIAFGENIERLRSVSVLSMQTIKALASFASLVSFSESQPTTFDDASSLCSPVDLDIQESTHQLLFNLRVCSPAINHSSDPVTLSRLSNFLAEATHLHQGIIRQFRCRVDEATNELEHLRCSSGQVQKLLHRVTLAAIQKLGDKGFDSYQRRRARDSEDSQATMFHDASRCVSSSSLARPKRKATLRESSLPKKGKLLNWFKRIIAHEKPSSTRLQIVYDIDEASCAAGRQVRPVDNLLEEDPPCVEEDVAFDTRIEAALKTCKAVLNASSRDLRAINQCLLSAEQFISNANQAISRAERVARRAIKKRETMLAKIRASKEKNSAQESLEGTPGALGYNFLTLRPSIASLTSVNSEHSVYSLAPTLMENDDEDTRILRRLFQRKIEAGVIASWDEMNKVMDWLRIVREATRGVKRRAYL